MRINFEENSDEIIIKNLEMILVIFEELIVVQMEIVLFMCWNHDSSAPNDDVLIFFNIIKFISFSFFSFRMNIDQIFLHFLLKS